MNQNEGALEKRIAWVDYAKGIGILLVVYGHLLSSAYHAGLQIPEHFFALSDSIVYSFHMPLFFFLAGLFVGSSYRKRGGRDYLLDKLARIAYPYFVWSILQVSVEVLFSSQTQKDATLADILAIPYRPWGQFWFIYALFLMHLVYALLNRFGKVTMPTMFLLSFGLFFFPIQADYAALTGFSTQFLFFVTGIFLGKYLLDRDLPVLPLWAILLLFAFLTGAGYYTFEYLLPPTRLTNGSHPVYFLFFSILGIMACLSLASYLSRKNILQPFKTLGNYSMQIYLAHMLAGVGARVILVYVFHLQNWILHIVLGVTVALTAPILLQRISDKLNFPYLFGNPKFR
jgi:fucose 4-O-acetylase-like acetyltransferase